MHPELTQMINAQRNREMRDQAAAWRRAHEARTLPKWPARTKFAAIAGLARNAWSLPGQQPRQRPAAT
jgi:hypothetical protein